MNTEGEDAQPGPGLHAGAVFGRYTIVRPMGVGGMGAVYEATHNDLKKRVALKTLHRVVAADPAIRARFVQEGQAASRIRHPHVVDVSDVGVQEGLPFLVMEYLDGEDLRRRFDREGRLDPGDLVALMLPLLSAVGAAHEEGIVHRDLKPENIFLARTRDGAVIPKVLDFGISKMTDAGRPAGLTASSSVLGTPFYMAPEQARSSRNVDARADLYALGVILYEGLTGKVPYPGENLFVVLTAAALGGCEAPRALRPEIDAGLEAVVLRAMAVAPDDRYPDATALGRALLPFATAEARARWATMFGGGPVRTVVDPEVRPAPAGTSGRRREWILGAAALATVVLVAVGSREPAAVATARSAPVTQPSTALVAQPSTVSAVAAAVVTAPAPATTVDAGAAPAIALPEVAVARERRSHPRSRRGVSRVTRAAAQPETSTYGAPLVD